MIAPAALRTSTAQLSSNSGEIRYAGPVTESPPTKLLVGFNWPSIEFLAIYADEQVALHLSAKDGESAKAETWYRVRQPGSRYLMKDVVFAD